MLWGAAHIDPRGKIVEEAYDEHNEIILLNNGAITHFELRSGLHTIIDLSFASISIACDSDWMAMEDNYDNDHYPIIIDLAKASEDPLSRAQRWIFKSTDWRQF